MTCYHLNYQLRLSKNVNCPFTNIIGNKFLLGCTIKSRNDRIITRSITIDQTCQLQALATELFRKHASPLPIFKQLFKYYACVHTFICKTEIKDFNHACKYKMQEFCITHSLRSKGYLEQFDQHVVLQLIKLYLLCVYSAFNFRQRRTCFFYSQLGTQKKLTGLL